jgi:hypothetical protein
MNQRKKASADWLQPVTAEQKQYRKHLTNHLKPRLPTEQERNELIDYVMAKDKTAIREHIEAFFDVYTPFPMVVFDHYETNGFAYEGKLLLVVSDYEPTIIEAYIWRDGKIEDSNKLHQQIERKEKAWLKHHAKNKSKHTPL